MMSRISFILNILSYFTVYQKHALSYLQLNIANENSTKIFTALYKEVLEVFENIAVMHFGGNGVRKELILFEFKDGYFEMRLVEHTFYNKDLLIIG